MPGRNEEDVIGGARSRSASHGGSFDDRQQIALHPRATRRAGALAALAVILSISS